MTKKCLSKLYVYTDGGSRGNPGKAAIGGVFFDESGKKVHEFKEFIGVRTNNQAEYSAVIRGLELAREFCKKKIFCFLDSELVVHQLNKKYKIRNSELRRLYSVLKREEDFFEEVVYTHVRRTDKFMVLADALVNQALDENS